MFLILLNQVSGWKTDVSKAGSAVHLAKFLRKKSAGLLQLCRAQPKKKGESVRHEQKSTEIMSCRLCGRSRHTCSWEYCTDEKCRAITKGGVCYCCVRTAHLLGISRSPQIIANAGAKDVFLQLQATVRAELGKKDVCRCKLCKDQ